MIADLPRQIGSLSITDVQILDELGLGRDPATIAAQLGISYDDVGNRLALIRVKLNVPSTAEAIIVVATFRRPATTLAS
jgi:DNA-binding CsgD family transcriptional regulator